ncbi:cytosine permease [Corynebacterium poyangense]|uniref:Cytosine permease n=1 Tax=Corynebacterium poyangense TaxID=2684405 RepID=A0A7H0SLD8_9CORY|nr:cytosine permease [Corynebacterium poyangense]MBZ8177455.1 cytosine permease [Corynebacterium poyangense]QNQ89363.1 cytosine permease [Corynebacterium poyangense]
MTDSLRENSPGVIRVERRSVGFIPQQERYGNAWNQFTLWFGANLQITTVVTGALAYVLGGDVFWSLIGLFIGQVAGGVVMALHSAQGPRLGLPQMISSRAQFGVYGAAIPLILIIFMYLGFAASGTVLAGQAITNLYHGSTWSGILIFGAASAVFAIIGYNIIHRLSRWVSVISIIAFAYLFFRFFIIADVGDLLSIKEFTWPSFLLAMALSASWQIAYGPYVADYSRYLPENTKSNSVFILTLAGTVISSTIAMSFGVFIAAWAGDAFKGDEVGTVVRLGTGGVVAGLIYLSIAIGKLSINVLNTYGGFMSMMTTYSGFRGKAEIPQSLRIISILIMTTISCLIALLGRDEFLPAFSSFLLFLLTFFIPWSAINLADFYWISKEKYDVPALADPDGRYGRWNVSALIAFIGGILIQLPFVATHFYTGPLVAKLGGADISWIVGLVATTVLYLALRPLDRRTFPDHTILPEENPVRHVDGS